MLDTVLRGARIAGAGADAPLVDIGIAGGTIAAVEPDIPCDSDADSVDLGGKLVSPGLVETHIHLDKSRIVDRCAPAAGRARDHMERVSAVKPGFTVEDVYARAAATLEQCILNGTTHVRTHVEVDPNVGLRSFEALEQLAVDHAWAVDLELCVFAQEGWTNVPETDRNIVAALERGASVVGGAPGYDPDAAGQIRRIFELAIEFDRDVDIHLDVGPSADEMDIGLVCDLTERHGYGGAGRGGARDEVLAAAARPVAGARGAPRLGRGRGDGAARDRPLRDRPASGPRGGAGHRGRERAHRARRPTAPSPPTTC